MVAAENNHPAAVNCKRMSPYITICHSLMGDLNYVILIDDDGNFCPQDMICNQKIQVQMSRDGFGPFRKIKQCCLATMWKFIIFL